MPKTVEIPNIGNVEFPDEMSPDQIVDAIKTRIIPQHQQKTQTVSAAPQFQDLSADQLPKFDERDQGYTPTIPRSQPTQTLKQLGAEAWEEANRSFIPEGLAATTLATTAGIASPTLLRLATEKAPKATAGVFEAADDLVRGAATPLSIGLLGIAGLPAAAQRTALVGIATWMGKNAVGDAKEAGKLFGEGDTEGGTRKIVNALAAAGLSAASFAGGVRPKTVEKPPVLPPAEAGAKFPQAAQRIELEQQPGTTTPLFGGTYQVQEPPIPEGMIRLYRGEPGRPPTYSKEVGKVVAPEELRGRWFTPYKRYALSYALSGEAKPLEGSQLAYIDVPAGTDLNKWRPPGLLEKNAAKGTEFILPEEKAGEIRYAKITPTKPPILKPSEELISDASKKAPQLQASIQEAGKEPNAGKVEERVAMAGGEPPRPIAQVAAGSAENVLETPGTSPQEAQGQGLVPAIQTPEGRVVTGEDHVSAYEKAKATGTPDTSGSKEGFQTPTEPFISREKAAEISGLPTKTEPGKLHSSDLPKTTPLEDLQKEGLRPAIAQALVAGEITPEIAVDLNLKSIGLKEGKPSPGVSHQQAVQMAREQGVAAVREVLKKHGVEEPKIDADKLTVNTAKLQGQLESAGAGKAGEPAKAPAPVEQKPPAGETPAKPLSVGPGAASVGEAGTYSPIQRMTDELRATAKPSKPIDTQLRVMDQAKAAVSKVGDAIQRSVANLRAVKDAIWEKYTGLPEYGDDQRAVGKWFYALQRADHEARVFGKQIIKEVPSKLRREAITNWIQADGDEAILRQRAAASKGPLKLGYEQALKLTDREKQIAQMFSEYFDQQLQRGIDAGILQSGLENYITQVWKKENPITKKLISDLAYGKLTPNFKYARKRMFDSYFEGEQAGYQPNKDAGFLAANYDQAFNRSLAARAFIKDLHEGKASDGRPLVELSGNGKVIGEDEGKPAVLITPHSKPDVLGDYRTIDHPALRGWKYATTTPEGNTVLVKGDMLVHPEAYQKLKNRLSVSAFRQNPVARTILAGQTTIKQTMLSVSGFHQVQETLHALGHRVNPKDMPEIDFSEPVTKALAEHGLQLADYNALEAFSEGLSGGGLMTKIPVIGKTLHAYNEWLFQDYIPRLKNQMAHLALERNRERYPKLSEDKLLELSASESNAAFGELPYRYMGRSPTLQDALRTFILAPDFLEARTRFAGRAMMPYGREQLVALGLLAGTQYITARIVNQILDNDPHWEVKNAFRIVAGNHAYGLRSIPGDMAHLVTDPRSFFYYRMSPVLKTATEYITGRDARGVKRDVMDQVKDLAEMPIPISMKSKMGQQWWESFLNSFGVQEQRYDAVQNIGQRVAEFKKTNNITSAHESTYDPEKDKYAALRMAVENGQEKLAKKEFEKLKTTTSADAIFKHFKLSYNRPFTGSAANESKFLNSLDETGKREYEEAKALRQTRLRMILSLGNQ